MLLRKYAGCHQDNSHQSCVFIHLVDHSDLSIVFGTGFSLYFLAGKLLNEIKERSKSTEFSVG
jgi:hypothetical protein